MSQEDQLSFTARWCPEESDYLRHVEACALLIAAGAGLDVKDAQRKTVRERVTALRHPRVEAALQAREATKKPGPRPQ